jgi:Methyltransferase FkbM domain
VLVAMRTFDEIVELLGHSHVDVLKMDIEGIEYDVLEGILNSKVKPNQLLIEFHDRFFPDGTLKTKRAIDALKSHGYGLFGVSDSLEELSFIQSHSSTNPHSR